MSPAPSFELFAYETVDSTNQEARRLLDAGRISGLTVVRADTQTAGRGTRGRLWISPPGVGLYFSLVHPFEGQQATIPLTPLFTLAAGLACAEALSDRTGLTIQLKPINDLYVQQCKLGGILVESIISQDRCKAIITGIGINLYTHDSLSTTLASADGQSNTPIALQACLPPTVFNQWQPDMLADELCTTLSHQVHQRYQQLIAGQAAEILTAYRHYQLPGAKLPDEVASLAGIPSSKCL